MIILHGVFERADGSPAAGVVDIRPVVSASDLTPTPVIVTQAPLLVTLDDRGSFAVAVRASDDDGWATDGPVPYRITRMIEGERTWWGTYLLLGVMGDRVDLARLTPITEGVGVPVPVPVPGPSAYEVAVEAGFVGTEEEWLASLHGQDGIPPAVRVVQTITGPAGGQASVVDVDPTDDVGLVVTIPTGGAGPAGPPNALAVGTVTTGAPGSQAAASITGTPPAQTLHLTIPAGQLGATGPAIGGLLTTKGDLVVRDATTAVRLPVGTAGQVLVADPTATTGVRWVGMVRTTRPNVDDRLVEMWDGTKWVATHYDSGVRNVAGLLLNGWAAGTFNVRRSGPLLVLEIDNLATATATAYRAVNLPAGLRPTTTAQRAVLVNQAGSVRRLGAAGDGNIDITGWTGSETLSGVVICHLGAAPIPTSLPGTLVTPAP